MVLLSDVQKEEEEGNRQKKLVKSIERRTKKKKLLIKLNHVWRGSFNQSNHSCVLSLSLIAGDIKATRQVDRPTTQAVVEVEAGFSI